MYGRYCTAALIGFVGYLLGRFGHCYVNVWIGNPGWIPHHWITAVVIMIGGAVFIQNTLLCFSIVSFGLGHFISDLRDFVKLRVIQPDDEGEKYFWHID